MKLSGPSQAVGRVRYAVAGFFDGRPTEHLAQPKSGSSSFRQLPRWASWRIDQGVPQIVTLSAETSTSWETSLVVRVRPYSPSAWRIEGTKMSGAP